MVAVPRDPPAGVPGLRTLGTGSREALAGNTSIPVLPKRIYYPDSYPGWHDDDANSDGGAIRLALADTCANGGMLVLSGKSMVLNDNGFPVGLPIPADMPHEVIIWITGSIRLGLYTRTFAAPDGVLTGNTHTYQNVTIILDGTLDAKNANGTDRPTPPAGIYGVLFSTAVVKANYANFLIRGSGQGINAGPLTTAGQHSSDGLNTLIARERRWIDFSIATTTDGLNSSTQYTMTNIRIDGRGGLRLRGGNVGAIIQGFYGGSDKVARNIWNVPWIANVWMQGCTIDDLDWDSTTIPNANTQPSVSGMGSAGAMIGGNGQGTDCWIRRNTLKGSGDPDIEMDSILIGGVQGNHCIDAWNVGWYLANIGGGADVNGLANPRQRLLIEGNYCERVNVLNMQLGMIHQPQFATPHGHLTFRNNTGYSNLSDQAVSGQNGFEVRTNFLSLDIDGQVRTELQPTITTPSASLSQRGLKIGAMGGRGTIRARIYEKAMMATAQTSPQIFLRPVLDLDGVPDHFVDVDVAYDHSFSAPNGAKFRSYGIETQSGQVKSLTDAFGANLSTQTDYIVDAGAVDGVSPTIIQSGGVLAPVAGQEAVETRLAWIGSTGSGSWCICGPFTDQGCSVKAHTGADVSLWKAGPLCKRIGPNDYIVGYADGATGTLRIDRVKNSVRTNLANTAITIAPATDYWIRDLSIGNVVTLDFFTSTTGLSTMATSGSVTVTATLSGSDIVTFGALAQGRNGFSWVPGDAAARLDDLAIYRMMVMRGKLVCRPVAVTGADVADGILFNGAAKTYRFPNTLKYSVDATGLAGNTTVAATVLTDAGASGSIADVGATS